jgi:hypothetical protein
MPNVLLATSLLGMENETLAKTRFLCRGGDMYVKAK